MIPADLRRLGFVLGLLVSAFFQASAADAPDVSAGRPAPASEAAQRMAVPEGFRVTLFAGEPDVAQPIAMTTDDRGRLWVVECFSYPNWQRDGGSGRDRVLIFEDRDGDGRFDSRKVFFDKGRNLSGIALGFGGVWLCSAPELLFIPDRNGDDVADGSPEPVLDGWTLEAKHNIFNSLTWGPDGWLYGCHGILADSNVGRPGAPASERTKINCGVWRFHPTRKVFEVVAHGTTNPWGIAFNEQGQMFIVNCVIKHLFHVIPGARYERMYGQDDNPYAFRLIESCADHIHWAGGWWKTEGAEHSQNDVFGGGHAHSGALIYLGDNWPERYRNGFFGINIHGHRVNHDALERSGSGYVARHRPDLLRANDPWFRGVALTPAADGGVFMADWTDAGECHDYIDIHRENGRVYKITYGPVQNTPVNLAVLSDAELVQLLDHKNDWLGSRARRLLQERSGSGKLDAQTRPALARVLREASDESRQLHALWALHGTGGFDEALVFEVLRSPHEFVRGWTVQLALENKAASPGLLEKLVSLAASDASPVVRLYLASALPRLPFPQREPVASALVARAEDADDANLPSMIWFGVEPLVSSDDRAASALLEKARIPVVREFIARRLALRMALGVIARALDRSVDASFQRDVVRGMFDALNGRRDVAAPPGWPGIAAKLGKHADTAVRDQAMMLSLVFGNAEAMAALRARAANPAEPTARREQALQALVQARVPGIAPLLQGLVADAATRGAAIRGLAAYEDAATPQVLLKHYARFTATEKADAINTFASRPGFAVSLLEAVKQGTVPTRDVSPFAARQIQALNDPRLPALLKAALGEVRSVSKDKAALIASLKGRLTPESLQRADRAQGRMVFNRACAACHTLFDEGGKIAPELTGSQRTSLDYLLENIIDPNAVVWDRYKATYFETQDDRLISGVVLAENESTVTIQTQTDTVILPRGEISKRTVSNLSMMPEGLLESLEPQQMLDLFAYLQSPAQVPLPGENQK